MAYFIFGNTQVKYTQLTDPLFSYAGELSPNQGYALHVAQQWLQGRDEFVIHTSGSTGKPKPIVWKRKLMQESAERTLKVLQVGEGDKILLCLSAHTAGGLMMLVRGLIANIPVGVVEPSGNPMDKLEKGHGYTLASFVPLQMHHILTGLDMLSVQKLNTFRKVLIGGASMSNEWSRRFTDLDPEFYHTYGMTETYTHIALRKLNGAGATARYVPLPGVQVSKDRDDRLVINGLATGYADVITNDRVQTYKDGSFEVLGRMDNIINSGGVKIQLERIEDALGRVKQFAGRDCIAWFIPDDELGQKLIAIIKGNPLPSMDEYEAKVDLRSFLERYEVPKEFFYISEFSFTQSGKVHRENTARMVLGGEIKGDSI